MSPARRAGHSPMAASSLLGACPARMEILLRVVAAMAPHTYPVASAKAHWQQQEGWHAFIFGSRRGKKHKLQTTSLNGDVLKEHNGTAATEVGFRVCSRDTVSRERNPQPSRQQKAHFSFKRQKLESHDCFSPLRTLPRSHHSLQRGSFTPKGPPAPPGGPDPGTEVTCRPLTTAQDSSFNNIALFLLQNSAASNY